MAERGIAPRNWVLVLSRIDLSHIIRVPTASASDPVECIQIVEIPADMPVIEKGHSVSLCGNLERWSELKEGVPHGIRVSPIPGLCTGAL